MSAIGKNKNKIKLKNFKLKIDTYDINLKSSLNNIQINNLKHKENILCKNHFEIFEEFKDKFNEVIIQDVNVIVQRNAKKISDLLDVHDMTNEEKSYILTPYANIFLKNDGTYIYSSIYNELSDNINEIVAEYENNFSYIRGKLKKIQHIKDEIRSSLYQNKKELNEAFALSDTERFVFEDRDEAASNLEEVKSIIFNNAFDSMFEIIGNLYSILEEELKLLANAHSTRLDSDSKIYDTVENKITSQHPRQSRGLAICEPLKAVENMESPKGDYWSNNFNCSSLLSSFS